MLKKANWAKDRIAIYGTTKSWYHVTLKRIAVLYYISNLGNVDWFWRNTSCLKYIVLYRAISRFRLPIKKTSLQNYEIVLWIYEETVSAKDIHQVELETKELTSGVICFFFLLTNESLKTYPMWNWVRNRKVQQKICFLYLLIGFQCNSYYR